MRIDATLSRITARVLIGPLACVGLLSCSSSNKGTYDAGTGAATSSSSAAPSPPSSLPSTAQSPEPSGSADVGMAPAVDTTNGQGTGGSAADTGAAPSRAPSPAGVHKHGSRSDHRLANGSTRSGAMALKRQGTRCVPLASDALARTNFSSSPVTINPCGLGSMNLPTLAPAILAEHR